MSNNQRPPARKVYFSFDDAGAFQGPETDVREQGRQVDHGNLLTTARHESQEQSHPSLSTNTLAESRSRYVRSPDSIQDDYVRQQDHSDNSSDFFTVVSTHKAEESQRQHGPERSSDVSNACQRRPSVSSTSTFGPTQRFPTTRSVARKDTRFVSAPVTGTDASTHLQHARQTSFGASDGIQTPLPLYHANSSGTLRRTASINAAYIRSQSDNEVASNPLNPNGGFRRPSDAASLRSAMKGAWSGDRTTDSPKQGEPRQQSYASTLSSLYDGMLGPSVPTAGSHQNSAKCHDEEGGYNYAWDHSDEPMEPDDPNITGRRRKSVDLRHTLQRQDSSHGYAQSSATDSTSKTHKKPMRKLTAFIDPIKNSAILSSGTDDHHHSKMQRYHSSVHAHIDERRRLVLKMAKALMLFGAPSHRVESQLNALARTLDVDAQFIHFPGIVIANFGDFEHSTSQCHFVKSKTEIALGRLNEIHRIYKALLSDDLSVANADRQISEQLHAPPEWSNLARILFSIVKCGMMAPINFSGSFVDVWISALFGGLLTFSQLCLAGRNQMFSNTFDIAMAILFSFLSRLLSAKSVFCYEAIASSGLIALLPGYAVLCASLELASKNMMAGSVRMVYAIIYSLFLGFALAIGSELYYWMDPASRELAVAPLASHATELMGSFTLANQTMPEWTGTFTFTNATVVAQTAGSIICARNPSWPWWRQSVPAISKAITVPLFALLSCLSFLHPLRSREVPVSVLIACIGYAANGFANRYIFNRSDVVSAIGSFVIGILGNAYSRIWNATAFTAITVAVNFLVPTGMAMAGGLAMTYKGSDGDLYTNGLSLGFRMVQVSIGITTGLFVSALLVHMLGNKRSNAVLFAF